MSAASDPHVKRLTGLEAWFALPGRTVRPPPRYKMAVVSFLAAFPIVQVMANVVAPQLDFLPPIGRGIVVSVSMGVVTPPASEIDRPSRVG